MNGLTRNLPIKNLKPVGERQSTVSHAVKRQAGTERGRQAWKHWQGSGKGKKHILTLSKTEEGAQWNGSRGRLGWIMKERERMLAERGGVL